MTRILPQPRRTAKLASSLQYFWHKIGINKNTSLKNKTAGKTLKTALAIASVAFLPFAVSAAEIMPDFATLTTGWTTDRYEPTSFGNVGTYQGRANVLGIEITSAGDLANRPSGFQFRAYNTQGRQYAVSGEAGSVLSADLYIPAGWGNSGDGSVRSDMWGVMTDGTVVSDYPIIGFSNYGGAPRYRVWDDAGWHDLTTTVSYDAWTAFSIEFTGSAYVYSINGSVVYNDNAIDGTTGFQAVIMQAYNFADPAISGATLEDYTAHWSNKSVPDVGSTLALLGVAITSLAAFRRKLSA